MGLDKDSDDLPAGYTRDWAFAWAKNVHKFEPLIEGGPDADECLLCGQDINHNDHVMYKLGTASAKWEALRIEKRRGRHYRAYWAEWEYSGMLGFALFSELDAAQEWLAHKEERSDKFIVRIIPLVPEKIKEKAMSTNKVCESQGHNLGQLSEIGGVYCTRCGMTLSEVRQQTGVEKPELADGPKT